jgi:hypothetical protein
VPDGECKEHNFYFSYDNNDDMGCPVCYGIKIGKSLCKCGVNNEN